MDYTIENCAPDCDVIHITVGDNADSQISITISREENGEVHVMFVDNMDNHRRNMVLGRDCNYSSLGV